MQFGGWEAARVGALLAMSFMTLNAQATYSLTALVGHDSASALNDSGMVVGSDYDGATGAEIPFIWNAGVTTKLGGYGIISANDINNSGQVTGGMSALDPTGQQTTHAYLYSNGVATDLDRGGWDSEGFGLNNRGAVVGFNQPAGPIGALVQPVLFSNGSAQVLNVPSSAPNTGAVAINDRGQIIASNGYRSFLIQDGTATDLGTLGAASVNFAYAINNSGEVVGGSLLPPIGYPRVDSNLRAYLYRGGVLTEIDKWGYSVATAINDAGQIVGIAGLDRISYYFAAVGDGGRLDPLSDQVDSSGAGWQLERAVDINNRGQILGVGVDPSGREEAFLLTPAVPEPASSALMLAGLGVVGVLVRRKRGAQT